MKEAPYGFPVKIVKWSEKVGNVWYILVGPTGFPALVSVTLFFSLFHFMVYLLQYCHINELKTFVSLTLLTFAELPVAGSPCVLEATFVMKQQM